MQLFRGPFWLRKPFPGELERLLNEQAAEDLSYSVVGGTRSGAPPGYAAQEFVDEIGHGEQAFGHAKETLSRWAPQRGAGMTLTPAMPPLAEGQTLVMLLPLWRVYVTAAARIVYVVDEPHRFGFAYGTLPHHPEDGEEAFFVERDDSDDVRFRIKVFSRPAHPLAKLGGPVATRVQSWTTARYRAAMREAARR